MRPKPAELLERYRIREGDIWSEPEERYGAFVPVPGPCGAPLMIIASDGRDWEAEGLPPPAWEHVSISLRDRAPNWREMCWVKDLFWFPEECVIQFHPPASVYVNAHPHCLHLWMPIGLTLPLPPTVTLAA